jgi:hypothetical protein
MNLADAPLSQALIIVFRESFPYVRESFSEEERSQYPPPYFDAMPNCV